MATTIIGDVWKFGDGIDTDLILPMHASMKAPAQQIASVFEANRPGWVDEVKNGDIIVAGHYFGIGSSRPAARVLKDLGIAAVVADSVNGLFMRNAINFGLPCFPIADISKDFREGDTAQIDLNTWTVTNRRTELRFNATQLPPFLKDIMLNGGLKPTLINHGYIRRERDDAPM